MKNFHRQVLAPVVAAVIGFVLGGQVAQRGIEPNAGLEGLRSERLEASASTEIARPAANSLLRIDAPTECTPPASGAMTASAVDAAQAPSISSDGVSLTRTTDSEMGIWSSLAALDTILDASSSVDQKLAAWLALRDAGAVELAIEELERAWSQDTGNVAVALELGNGYAAQMATASPDRIADWSYKAVSMFDRVLEQRPKDWNALLAKATLLASLPSLAGLQVEAVRAIDRLVAQQEQMQPRPDFVRAYVMSAHVRMQTGQREDAIYALTRGLELYPENPELARQLEVLSSIGQT